MQRLDLHGQVVDDVIESGNSSAEDVRLACAGEHGNAECPDDNAGGFLPHMRNRAGQHAVHAEHEQSSSPHALRPACRRSLQ